MGEAGLLRTVVGAGVNAGLAPGVPYCRGSAFGGRVAAAPSEGTDAANAAMRGGGVEPRPYDDPRQ